MSTFHRKEKEKKKKTKLKTKKENMTDACLWTTPIGGLNDVPVVSGTVLDYSRRDTNSHNIEVPWLRTHVLQPSSFSSCPGLSLRLARNNLRIRRGGEQLANMLTSMLHRSSCITTGCGEDTTERTTDGSSSSSSCPCKIEELDISSTGAFEDSQAWTIVFRSMSAMPTSFLKRLVADDETMPTTLTAPLLESIATSFVHLTHVSLRRCLLNSTAMESVARGILARNHSTLEFLDVSENELSSLALATLCGALHESEVHRQSIRILNLADNSVGSVCGSGEYCRKGLLSLALLILHAPNLREVSVKSNRLGDAYPPRWPVGGDHGGVSEVCEAARRSIATRGEAGKPPVIDISANGFCPPTCESLHRCSGFTAKV